MVRSRASGFYGVGGEVVATRAWRPRKMPAKSSGKAPGALDLHARCGVMVAGMSMRTSRIGFAGLAALLGAGLLIAAFGLSSHRAAAATGPCNPTSASITPEETQF